MIYKIPNISAVAYITFKLFSCEKVMLINKKLPLKAYYLGNPKKWGTSLFSEVPLIVQKHRYSKFTRRAVRPRIKNPAHARAVSPRQLCAPNIRRSGRSASRFPKTGLHLIFVGLKHEHHALSRPFTLNSIC